MSASRDWVSMEAAISLLLPGAGGPPARPQLLATLAEYSAAATREARLLGAITPSAAECAEALEWLQRPLFICGHHRSGTTLLQNLLDGHPQLLVLPSEGTYFSSFDYVARRNPSDEDMDRFATEWISRFVDPNFEPHCRLGKSDASRNPAVGFARMLFGWHETLRNRVPSPFAPLLALAAAFRSASAPSTAPSLWAEKTPRNEHYTDRLAAFAGARFIHLVRDPRASLASLEEIYRASHIGGFDAAEQAREIGRSLRLALDNPSRLGERYIVVRYEDLVEQPVRQMERIGQFLGIASDPTLLVPTAGGRAVRANSSFRSGVAGIIEPRRDSVMLSGEHSALLRAYAGSPARTLGYDVPAGTSIASYAIRLRHWPRHALRSARSAFTAVLSALIR
jgi:Sulfotransferase family